jgi:general secretion pathway protein G
MKNIKFKKAFTMIELVFVIVVIGILAGVAIPRLAATRDDAEITKAMTTLNSVRNALSIERQKRILRGEFSPITAIGSDGIVFGHFFDKNGDTGVTVLEYPEPSSSDKYHWKRVDDNITHFCLTNSCETHIDFELSDGRFICKLGACSMLGVTAE